ncbi:MAG TPA: substrate-binding domain-containing protein [Ferruginibacter sp.]|nr:phosphate ABC transporter substrate-binding protein, PhoT family [Chitinophagaceae bacterium]HRI25877.1 substrate-binding domain-containing protein [Ferruginibacter sp.]
MNKDILRQWKTYSLGFLLVCFCMGACRQGNKDPFYSLKNGTIRISVDESFKPVMEEQIQVFEKSFPGATITAAYKSEATCFKDLFTDTATRMIIVTRGPTAEEERFFKDSLDYTPKWNTLAYDAITILVNKKSNDTLFTLQRLQQQLLGKQNRNQQVVFDGLNATSTVRFVLDSILKGARFDTGVVKAVKSSQAVINYVAENENAIGFVGISWIGNPEDSAQVNMLNKVKIAYVSCDLCPDSPYVKPTQASILSRRYPLVRGLYYIVKESSDDLGTGFSNFMRNERGQLIFKRAYLGTVMDFDIRNVKLNQKL